MTLELLATGNKQSHSENQQETQEETEYETKKIVGKKLEIKKTGKVEVNFPSQLFCRKINTTDCLHNFP